MRSDLGASRGDLDCVKGRSIGAAPWVDMGLKRLLIDAGYDLERDDIRIAPVPGALNAGVNFGINAARALEEGKIDGFWANGMGTEVAVRRGVGTVVLDVRRGDGPPGCFDYTFSALATSDELLRQASGRRGGGRPRDREDTRGAQARPASRDRRGAPCLSCRRNRADCRADPP